ncbi:MAG: ATP-grasp domain-containing protein [Minisyncoccia bacterium]|jgi:carbamoyl-phosphate synthase large subunit
MQSLFFQDNQVHSTWSDGTFSLEEIFEYNRTHERLDLTVSDHVDKNTDWFERYVEHLSKLRKKYPEFSVRIGCEVKILDDGTLNATDVILKQAEVVLGSVHHFEGIKAMSPDELMAREYELTKLLAQNKQIDILAHPFNMSVRFYKSNPSAAWVKDVYTLCAKNGIKFEYNHKYAPQSVKDFVAALVKKGETKHLSFGSDMHHNLTEIGQSGFKAQAPVTILVTGAGAGVGQSILKALKLSPVSMRILAADGSELAAGLYTADAAYIVPMYRDTRYIPRIIEICKKEKVDIIFAGTDVELEALSQNAKKIKSAAGAVVVVSNMHAVRIADDKWKTVQFLKQNGFPYAKSCLAKNLPVFLKTATWPLIVKPRIGARSIGVCKVSTKEELTDAVARTPGAIIQEYLATDDNEYTCSGFFYKSKSYGVLCGQRWLRNGDTYKALFKHDKELEAFIAKVGAKLNLFGPCNFQLRKTKRGPVIFEINCRFSGTTGAMSYLGFNVANALVQILCLKRPPSTLYCKESYMFRYWNELFVSEDQVKTLGKKGELEDPHSEKNLF